MKASTSFGLAIAVALVAGLWGSSARAGFTSIQTSIVSQGDTATFVDVPNGALAITAPSTDTSVGSYNLWGTIDSDPDLTITEKIKNNSANPWNAYSVSITPDPGYVVTNVVVDGLPPSATDWLPQHSVTTSDNITYTILYFGGQVPVGQTLYAIFDFTISDVDGNFGYHVVNAPNTSGAPEPASLAMVGLGATLLLRRRRRRA